MVREIRKVTSMDENHMRSYFIVRLMGYWVLNTFTTYYLFTRRTLFWNSLPVLFVYRRTKAEYLLIRPTMAL